jgi:hypothetical protein
MISDVLCEALDEIERYQRDFSNAYGESKEAIEKVKAVMSALRSYLDCPPAGRYLRYDAAVEQLRQEIGAIDLEGVAAALENARASWPTPEEVDAANEQDNANESGS